MKAEIEGVTYKVIPCLLKDQDRAWICTEIRFNMNGNVYEISQAEDGLAEIVAVGLNCRNVYQLDIE